METSHLGMIFNKIINLFRKIFKKRNKETETIIENTEENNMLQETIYDNRELSWLKFNKEYWKKQWMRTIRSVSVCRSCQSSKAISMSS